MYAENTTTGINLMDLTRQQALVIHDSLRRAIIHCILSDDERALINDMMRRIEPVCKKTSKEKNL